MRGGRLGALVVVAAAAGAAQGAAATGLTPETIFVFNGQSGASPVAPPVAGSSGQLYVTTAAGGADSLGVVVSLSPPSAGKIGWVQSVLHSFAGGADGSGPLGPVVLDGTSIYGTTSVGGSGTATCYADAKGCGTVFSLSPKSGGGFTYTILHRFSPDQSANDGAEPVSGLSLGARSLLYGTTSQGGGTACSAPGAGCGVFYGITAAGAYSILYRFQGGADANSPVGSLSAAPGGVLYGVSQFGGNSGSACAYGSLGCGTVFRLTPNAGGTSWTETVIYSFTGGADGSNPGAPVKVDTNGVLYGTTTSGGSSGYGVVFSLTPPAAGSTLWTENVLYSFTGGSDGGSPQGGLVIMAKGVLMGTTPAGGDPSCAGDNGCGVLFQLSPPSNGSVPWTETVLHSFTGDRDGGESVAGLVYSGGVYYGTTFIGGTPGNPYATGYGTVFDLIK